MILLGWSTTRPSPRFVLIFIGIQLERDRGRSISLFGFPFSLFPIPTERALHSSHPTHKSINNPYLWKNLGQLSKDGQLTLIKRLWQRDSTLVTVSPNVIFGYILCAHRRYISSKFDRSVACDTVHGRGRGRGCRRRAVKKERRSAEGCLVVVIKDD